MKKSTKKMLMAACIVLIFVLSSVAFVFSSFGGPGTNTVEIKPLDSFVVDGPISPNTKNAYIQNGFTVMEVYYNSSNSMMGFFEQTPELFKTPDGRTQLIVEKLRASDNYAKIVNANGENYIYNLTASDVVETLCAHLIIQPTECAIKSLNISY